MEVVFNAANITEAHIVSGLIRSFGIHTYVGGDYLQGGIGELVPMNFATVQVGENDSEQALEIVAEYQNSSG